MTTAMDEPTRNKVLGGYLIGLVLVYLVQMITDIGFMVGYIQDHDLQFTGNEQWTHPLLIVVEIATIGALVALWFWRKAGYRVLIVTSVLETILLLLLNFQFLTALVPLFGLVIMWRLLQKQWQYFH